MFCIQNQRKKARVCGCMLQMLSCQCCVARTRVLPRSHTPQPGCCIPPTSTTLSTCAYLFSEMQPPHATLAENQLHFTWNRTTATNVQSGFPCCCLWLSHLVHKMQASAVNPFASELYLHLTELLFKVKRNSFGWESCLPCTKKGDSGVGGFLDTKGAVHNSPQIQDQR